MAGRSSIDWVDAANGRRQKLPVPDLRVSSGHAWTGVTLECSDAAPTELPEGYLLKHGILLHLGAPQEGEVWWPGKGWTRLRLMNSSLVILPARVPYAARSYGGGQSVAMQIAPELVTSVISLDRGKAVDFHVEAAPTQDRLIEQAMLAMEEDLRNGHPAGRLYGETLGMAIAAQLLRRFTVQKFDKRGNCALSPELLRRLLEYIDENIATDLSLPELAGFAQLNAHSFFRSFKHATGCAPHQYVLLKRVERAKSLLRDTTRPIADVALMCGFGSQSHLATAFRRATKMSPRAFRNAAS